jgi:carbonic anhydrase
MKTPSFLRLPLTALALLASSIIIMAADEHAAGVAPDDALKRLQEGNARFAAGKNTLVHEDAKRRIEVAKTQKPFAIIVGCSDSRVGPEVVFDQGIGDIFVVRTAGQVLDDPAIGSIEYAVEHLGAALIMVLGHERCGAVAATVAGGEAPANHVASLIKAIQPAVEKSNGKEGDALDNAVRENVREEVAQLKASEPVLAGLVKDGKIKIVGARYDLDTGKVEPIE